MKRVRTSELRPGMKTAEDVYSYNNQMIMPKNTILDDKMITRLEFYSVLAIRIAEDDEEVIEEVKTSFIEPTTSYFQKVKESKEFKEFETTFLKTTENFKESLKNTVENGAPLDTKTMLNDVTGMVAASKTSTGVFDMLHNMRQYDDLTYIHSMNVAIICNVFAKWLGLGRKEVEIATLGGLLHDIGKLKIPDSITKKPDKLTPAEYNIIKTHPLQGYNILKPMDIDDNVKQCALMHHERCDGSGYPLGIVGDRTNYYAKMIAIADVYDAMTSARVYRGPLCPFKVIGIFESEGLNIYDGHFLLTFLEHVSETYMNTRVRLNSGDEGDVIFMNKNRYSKPLIKCGDKYIDLSREPDLYIETFV